MRESEGSQIPQTGGRTHSLGFGARSPVLKYDFSRPRRRSQRDCATSLNRSPAGGSARSTHSRNSRYLRKGCTMKPTSRGIRTGRDPASTMPQQHLTRRATESRRLAERVRLRCPRSCRPSTANPPVAIAQARSQGTGFASYPLHATVPAYSSSCVLLSGNSRVTWSETPPNAASTATTLC
jgi:hypothetical protein